MQVRGEKLEERILDAAERLFAKQGFAATGMRAISQAARASIGAVYHHFRNKEAILERIMHREIDERRRFLEGLRREGLPLQAQIERIVRMHFNLLRERSAAARLFFRERFDPTPALRSRFQALYDEVAEYISGVLKKGIVAGEIRPCNPLLAAYAILGMVESVSLRAMGEDETADLFMEEGPGELARLLLSSLGSERRSDE